ncbi:MAG: glycosyltransferase family 25 protein [Haemophilus parainfluenzae]|uniref:Beta-1,4-galactosyltransferase n=1 Tax=Haemophilus parainfluenzae TaxID=729 RepID=A0A448PZX9_HAEPA|nr:glycosyltransferase family 25 protein [Haemophilus parainfluenzae]MDU4895525.1 glycosyltransferase family 25 protein [Haemophilus parainfluenzae]MDU6259583.1 glycosyltransferase family 25 protein [Haemophilus parainfluenzae]VEI30212.1 beta-1,4-galactosyltransferase [Haemophilus parainfluenzae]
MAIPKIIVISLKHSKRRENIAKRLSGLGLDFSFFDATDGKKLSASVLESVDYDFYPKHYLSPKPLTLGEIGCAMSHINVYEYIIENNIESAIVLEDDAIVSHYFEEIVQDALNKVGKKYDLIFLDHGKAKSYLCKKKLYEGYRLVHYKSPSKNSKRFITCTAAYLITQLGASKLLNYAYPVRMPSDYLTGLIQKNKMNAYGIEPPCVFRGLSIDSEINQVEERYE